MKRRRLTIITIIISTLVVVIAIFRIQNTHFSFDTEYYGSPAIQAIDSNTLRQLITDKKSFGLFVSQPACQASADLEKHLEDFTHGNSLKFYEISFTDLKDGNFVPDLRFYPSFVIFHDGEVVDFLAANSDEDAAAYMSVDGFKAWLTEYVKLEI